MDTSAFTAADWRRGGMTAGRYGSNSLPIAWQIFAQLALKYCGNIVSSGSIGLSAGEKKSDSFAEEDERRYFVIASEVRRVELRQVGKYLVLPR